MKTSLKKAAAVICIMAIMGVKGPVSANAEDQSEPLNGVSVLNGHTYKPLMIQKPGQRQKTIVKA